MTPTPYRLEALAKIIMIYRETEQAFMEEPNLQNFVRYDTATASLWLLRDAIRSSMKLHIATGLATSGDVEP